MEKDRNITNVSHIYKKGVKELFYKIIESALRDYEETASFKLGNKNTDYKEFLKFIHNAYSATSLHECKIKFSELDESTYKKITKMFIECCKDVSYDNFAKWIRNNEGIYSLYNINEKEYNRILMQITFYKRVRQIMLIIYENLNYDSYGIVRENYKNSLKVYELLQKEYGLFDECDNRYKKYDKMNVTELKKALIKIENMEKKRTEILSDREILDEKEYILNMLISKGATMYKMEYIEYVNKKQELSAPIKRFKMNNISYRERYLLNLKRDIRAKKTEFEIGDDPNYVKLVNMCIEEQAKNPKTDIDKIIEYCEKELYKLKQKVEVQKVIIK